LNVQFVLILAIFGCFGIPCSLVSVSSTHAQTSTGGGNGAIMRDGMWGVELRLDGYREWTDHPLYGKPNLVLAGQSNSQSCEILLSMFAEVVSPGTSASLPGQRCDS